ncbi:hypothetical protein GGS23DRAFT_331218 [Durotheca rogersii]|uniref:uncharacterized protein n=1 Tax=Durotheca rogersii TaxID=419775 RepID=UPI00221EFF25|nr:uncharacterized protein GGS23DRAFT_331218 [Durotheca rogersii]KAI5859319.1 hypothetical protein GGS23DRAFT_331218 [Durotheca rogersii]
MCIHPSIHTSPYLSPTHPVRTYRRGSIPYRQVRHGASLAVRSCRLGVACGVIAVSQLTRNVRSTRYPKTQGGQRGLEIIRSRHSLVAVIGGIEMPSLCHYPVDEPVAAYAGIRGFAKGAANPPRPSAVGRPIWDRHPVVSFHRLFTSYTLFFLLLLSSPCVKPHRARVPVLSTPRLSREEKRDGRGTTPLTLSPTPTTPTRGHTRQVMGVADEVSASQISS